MSSSDSEGDTVHVQDGGSNTRCVRVLIQGVPAVGIIDSGADITIMGGALFKKVTAVARLRKRDFHKADKIPRGYDQRPFHLDGRMDLDISFQDQIMTTPVYLKMDAHDQLLLSEGVCRQIITYHSAVEAWRGGRKQPKHHQAQQKQKDARVPTVRIRLLQSMKILPGKSVQAPVHLREADHHTQHHCSWKEVREWRKKQDYGWKTVYFLLQHK